jgi:LmbE family N-acetylglucosaminyl deacetylase
VKVLAIGAHPDDLEILCAGTLARFVTEGHDVVMAHASVGDKGHGKIPHHEVGQQRLAEAQSAARVIGASSETLGFRDGEIAVNDENMRKVVELVRRVQPDLIITHHPEDYHGDHSAVTGLVVDASFLATLPYYITSLPAHPIACPVYFMDTLAGVGFEPSEYVDISETIHLKMAAMQEHKSQITWLKEHHASDILELIDTVAAYRGLQSGVQYAEGFQPLRAWGRLPCQRLLP